MLDFIIIYYYYYFFHFDVLLIEKLNRALLNRALTKENAEAAQGKLSHDTNKSIQMR